MTTSKTIFAILATLAAFGTPVAVAQMQDMDMQKMMQAMSPQPNDSASTRDLKSAQMNMMKTMNVEFSGNADSDFARSMMKHHQSGIEMAEIQLKHGKDPAMRKMAEKLVKEQKKDNQEFQAWLKSHQK